MICDTIYERNFGSMSIFAISSQRMVTFFTPGVQRKLWKVHVNYPMDTCRDDVPAGQPKTGQDSKS